MSETVTLPVAFLSILLDEDERIGPRTKKDPTPYWFSQSYDEGYVLRGRAATPDEIEAQATLDAALVALYAKKTCSNCAWRPAIWHVIPQLSEDDGTYISCDECLPELTGQFQNADVEPFADA